jgi:hypothetical protein
MFLVYVLRDKNLLAYQRVNRTQQHRLGVQLLQELGLTYVRLEPGNAARYRYVAWNTPLIDTNGSPRIIKRGWLERR